MTDTPTRAERLGLEPGSTDQPWSATYSDVPPTNTEIAHSIAISLKRIADALDGTALGVDTTESLAELTYQGVYKS